MKNLPDYTAPRPDRWKYQLCKCEGINELHTRVRVLSLSLYSRELTQTIVVANDINIYTRVKMFRIKLRSFHQT